MALALQDCGMGQCEVRAVTSKWKLPEQCYVNKNIELMFVNDA